MFGTFNLLPTIVQAGTNDDAGKEREQSGSKYHPRHLNSESLMNSALSETFA
jgi:hypothetical protein